MITIAVCYLGGYINDSPYVLPENKSLNRSDNQYFKPLLHLRNQLLQHSSLVGYLKDILTSQVLATADLMCNDDYYVTNTDLGAYSNTVVVVRSIQ